ncbi:Transcription factor MYB3R-4 [Hondaea fermentalgiana]|uniref:Transcription factor MYB3R-4 n=1 Tax=Hondaea fermentalgiana TaxID=2315210 RepID=A0A2R5GPA3_9STRA|nr:Transcription factor MYB3R-4 [Hondaea fermentalgiana]|eukprot:GBG31608.1 Transcription factor MYB3R-4 [Hondaea fermentalgiana]
MADTLADNQHTRTAVAAPATPVAPVDDDRDLPDLDALFDPENAFLTDTDGISVMKDDVMMLDAMVEMTDEFLEGVETPLTTMAVFNEDSLEPSKPSELRAPRVSGLEDDDTAHVDIVRNGKPTPFGSMSDLRLKTRNLRAASLSRDREEDDHDEHKNIPLNVDPDDSNDQDEDAEVITSKDSALRMIEFLHGQLRAKQNEIEELKRSAPAPQPFESSTPRQLRKNLNDDFERIVEEAVAAVEETSDEEWTRTPQALKTRAFSHQSLDLHLDEHDMDDVVGPVASSDILSPVALASPSPSAASSLGGADDDDESDAGGRKKTARRWTPEQDEELRRAVDKHNGQNWKAIANLVHGRDHVQCLQRWKKVLQPGLVKGMWRKEEDDLLLELMSTSKPKNWADVAQKIPGRTAKQCRERWSLNLDPCINRGAWTQAEDELLLKLHTKLGNRWAEIKRHLKGRTENGVKTRFKSIERARAKDQEVVWTPELEKQLHDISVRFDCKIDEVAKHLPRSLRGISSQAMRDHCKILREAEARRAKTVAANLASAMARFPSDNPLLKRW